jgi:hypothetical protein
VEEQPVNRRILLGLIAAAFCWIPLARGAEAAPASVTIKVTDKQIDLLAGNELVGSYHIDPALAKPHFHPLLGPNGKPITRAYPMVKNVPNETSDHPHQRALWFCHGDVIPEGLELKSRNKGIEGVDFWAEGAGRGRIVCVEVGQPQSDGHHASIRTRNEWRTAEGQKILDETRVLHLYDLGLAKLLVFDIDLHASVVPITFGDTKEGSFGVRVADSMAEQRRQGGVLENAQGKRTEKECWGMASAWCDYSGPVDGKTVGIAIFDDPKNPSPAHWHSRGYGLMAANPFGRNQSGFPATKGRTDLVKLAKGEHLKLRYGVLVHPGDAKEGKVAEHYQEFLRVR